MGADVVLDYREVDVVAEVQRLTDGGVDVAIEALGTQQTFENALRCLRPGGTLKERMRRLLHLVQSGRFDPAPLLTHAFALDDIGEGYRLFGERLDQVMKVAIRP